MGDKLLKEIEKGSKLAVMKKRIITHYIYNGSSTITDLAKEMDLSVPTVTKFIDEMCEDGYINDYGKLETSGGRHPSLYGLNAESGYFVGVEVRQFSIHLGLINFKGDVMQLKMNVPFRAKNTPECLDELCKIIKQFLQKLPIEQDKVLNINVNLSGRVNPDLGYSYSIFNFDERPLSDIISEKLGGFRVSIDNDTRAMIYGEYMQGAVKGDVMQLKMNVPFRAKNTPECLDELCKIIKQFLQKLPIEQDKVLNINVNLSGRVNPDLGYSYSIFNFDERPLSDIISEKLGGFRVSIDNDTRAMIYGEYMQGAVKGEKNIILINVSWGLGMGIIIDGKLYKGKSGFSGEFGHNYGYENEIICHCGKKGCIETEVSGSALQRILLEHIKNGETSIISNSRKNIEEITLDDIIAAVNKEDLLCIELVEEIGVKLGRHVAGLINIFNPELVIIGGDLSRTGDYLIQPITTAIRKYTLNLMNRDSVIVESKLKERAGIIGACMLSRSKLFES